MYRPIRSFVRREGRLTTGQASALARLWPVMGVELGQSPLMMDTLFARRQSVWLEIGFGNGESLVHMAQQFPQINFLGVEVYRPGIGHVLQQCEQQAVDNVRVIAQDAVMVLQHYIASAVLDRVMLYFPDPWPKKRHHKRRIVQVDFVTLIADKLKPGGVLHIATDWQPYAEHIRQVMQQVSQLTQDDQSVSDRPQTQFERRGLTLGHTIWDFIYRRH